MIGKGTPLKTSNFSKRNSNLLCHNCPTHLSYSHTLNTPPIIRHKCPIPISPLCLTSHFMCVQFFSHGEQSLCQWFSWIFQLSSGRKWPSLTNATINSHALCRIHIIEGQRSVRIAPSSLHLHHSGPDTRESQLLDCCAVSSAWIYVNSSFFVTLLQFSLDNGCSLQSKPWQG